MEENHLITICNRQTINGETEEICLTTMGTYAEKGGNRYIIYQEYDQETGQPTQTSTLKITPNHAITLMRNNTNRTNLILEEGPAPLMPIRYTIRKYDAWCVYKTSRN